MIKLENIKKRYGDKILFENINLEINKGDLIGIIGKSGSGKSTLLNIMSLIERQSSGKIFFDGEEVKANTSKAQKIIRYGIGYLFQNYALIDNKSIKNNMEIAMKYNREIKNKDKSIEDALIKVGLNNNMGQKIYTLSGGEQQRVALARLLVKPLDIIFADEPTGNLDKINSDKIMNILFDLNKEGKTVIVVTHDLDYLEKFNRVFEIEDKNLIERNLSSK